MAKGIKICKVCGREYEACHTLRPNLNNEFRWQEVACSPEHGAEYLRQVLIARGQASDQKTEEAAEPREETAAAERPVKKARKKKQAEDEDAAV